MLSASEFEALLAHELAHLETRDALVQTVAYSLVQTVVGLVGLTLFPVVVLSGGIARSLALLRGDPSSWSRSVLGRTQRYALQVATGLGFAVTLLVLGYSRRRELAADDRMVEVTGNPVALVRALRTVERASEPGLGPLGSCTSTARETTNCRVSCRLTRRWTSGFNGYGRSKHGKAVSRR